MKNIISFIFILPLFLIGMIMGYFIHTNAEQAKLIKAYQSYQNSTETLLNELDSAYNWVDGYDNYEYYYSKAKIDSLSNI